MSFWMQQPGTLQNIIDAACSCRQILAFGEYQILSKEVLQQGDWNFVTQSNRSSQDMNFMLKQDLCTTFILSGLFDTVASDVQMIAKDIGNVLNPTKCEIICFDEKSVNMKIFKDYIRFDLRIWHDYSHPQMTSYKHSTIRKYRWPHQSCLQIDLTTGARWLNLLKTISTYRSYSIFYKLRHAAATICWRNLTWFSRKISQRS